MLTSFTRSSVNPHAKLKQNSAVNNNNNNNNTLLSLTFHTCNMNKCSEIMNFQHHTDCIKCMFPHNK